MTLSICRPETYNPPDVDPVSMERLDVGEQLDPPGNPKKNKGFFEKGLLQAFEDDFGGREVKVVANGHSHRMFLPLLLVLTHA